MHLPWREVAPGAGPAMPTSITEDETKRLRELAAGCESVLEVGAAYGYSTVVLAQEAHWVVSVDPHITHNSYGTLSANINAYGLAGKVEIRKQFSRDVLPGLIVTDLPYDLVFIDGDHTAAGVEFDLTCAFQLVKPGGFIAVHDVLEQCCCPDVGPTLNRLLADRAYAQTYEIVDSMAVLTA